MIETLIRPVTRQLGVALTVAAAVLCIPTPGFAEPIGLSNMASFAVRDVPEVLPTYSAVTHQGDGFAVLADDLRDSVRVALGGYAGRPSGDRELVWTGEQIGRSGGASLSPGSIGSMASSTTVPISIPEPKTLILLGAGLVGAVMWTRRRIVAGRFS